MRAASSESPLEFATYCNYFLRYSTTTPLGDVSTSLEGPFEICPQAQYYCILLPSLALVVEQLNDVGLNSMAFTCSFRGILDLGF